jgi:hypothetical protein
MPQQNVFVISNKTEFIDLNPTCICTIGQYIRYIGSLHWVKSNLISGQFGCHIFINT